MSDAGGYTDIVLCNFSRFSAYQCEPCFTDNGCGAPVHGGLIKVCDFQELVNGET